MLDAGAAIQSALDDQRRADLRRIDPLIAALREAYELVPWIDIDAIARDVAGLGPPDVSRVTHQGVRP